MKISALIFCIALAGCSSTGGRSVLDRVEFDDDEVGCARIMGEVGTTFGAKATVLVVKRKGGDAAPDC